MFTVLLLYLISATDEDSLELSKHFFLTSSMTSVSMAIYYLFLISKIIIYNMYEYFA